MISYLKSLFLTFRQSFDLDQKKGTILLLGLDNAGKTTFLHRLCTSLTGTTKAAFAPTEQPTSHQFHADGITFTGWDLGGQEAVRHLWTEHTFDADGILFMVDAGGGKDGGDDGRLGEARDELDALICGDDGDNLKGVPLAIMLNKCDLDTARKSKDVAVGIGYDEVVECHGEENVRMFRMSVTNDKGYQEALRWIAEFL
mmetsp:Transcript_15288/g.18108  ORF Transcript_15288/g.18108 Transcript_15288/m.18108 type:complete len:200 (+) Transcript_15288:1-600(+)